MERSADASAARIVAIATQTYGMTLASDVETLELADPEAEADAGEGASLLDGEPVVAQAEAASEAGL